MGKRNRHQHENNEAYSSKGYGILPIVQTILLVVLVVQLVLVSGKLNDLYVMGSMPMMDDDEVGMKAAPMPTPTPTPTPTAAPTPTIDMKSLMDDDAVKGSASATVTIVEFSDYECPFCARFYRDTYNQIVEKYIDTGKVKLVFRDFPLSFHQQAQKAAEAAECAGEQGKYYDMHDILFEKGVTGGVASFKQYAADIGLDTAKFNTCLDSGSMADEVAKDMADGQKAGIRGTPGFIINGELVSGAQPFSVFDAAIQKALGN